MESIWRDRRTNLIVDGIEVTDDGVGHESTRQACRAPPSAAMTKSPGR